MESLTELALNLRSSWNHSADELWAEIDPGLWARTNNPWAVLQSASPDRLAELLASEDFRVRVLAAQEQLSQALAETSWFQRKHPASPLGRVAYFSIEFAVAESLPIYSGGLGNAAGDQIKAASDLGVPMVGVGLLYQQGSFRQIIGADGRQEALYPYNDPHLLPIRSVRRASGDPLRLAVDLPGQAVWLRAWEARVGRTPLYLLDANDPANPPAIRGITSELYGGGPEVRLRQEILLGIGGWLLLRATGISPQICHLNGAHAAFAVLERAAGFMAEAAQPFDVALEVTRAGNVFTTRASTPTGFDRFPEDLVRRFLRKYAEQRLGIGMRGLMALGRLDPDDPSEPFDMGYLAIRGSGAVNGVSRLHGQVSRRRFHPLYSRWPESEVPIGHVTHGVHTPSWDSPEADRIWTDVAGPSPWTGSLETVENDLPSASDVALWAMRNANRKRLVDCARERLVQQEYAAGALLNASPPRCLDPDVLTLGFARRFAACKRPNLLLFDRERLLRLLTDPVHRVQLVIAGKAHPADESGQEMIASWRRFIRNTPAQDRVVFIADHDLLLAEELARGVDVWINTPRRPLDATGTSGMKVLVNGGLNLSELDGWWEEAYDPEVGWAIGDGRDHGGDPVTDAVEADALYRLLEEEVVPQFYARDARGLPRGWIAKMRASMFRLTPRFSANRMLREYTETYYLPAASRYRARAAGRGALGAEIVRWRRDLERALPGARFGDLHVSSVEDAHQFRLEVQLGDVDPNGVQVELYADPQPGGEPERHVMARGRELAENHYLYVLGLETERPADHYTPRLVPHHPAVSVPLEAGAIRWHR